MNMEFFAVRNNFGHVIDLFGRSKNVNGLESGRWAYATNVTFLDEEAPEQQGVTRPPFITLDLQSVQQLMDELWKVGVRPSEGTGSAGALKATEYHLEDLRRLVFEKGGGGA